jgi:hypothetical protein
MPGSRAYNEVDDQPALTTLFDTQAARSARPSFEKCHRELQALLRQVAAITPGFLEALES